MRIFVTLRNVIFALLVFWPSLALAQDNGYRWWLREVRFGVLGHDLEVIENFNDGNGGAGTDNAEDGLAINGELVFEAPVTRFSEFFFNPDPFIGAHINTEGNTNFLYGGFAWNHTFENRVFIEGTFGLAVHDGELETPRNAAGFFVNDGRASLGTRVLFRESIELGIELNEQARVSAHFSHVSNGGFFGTANEGMDFAGIRWTTKLD